MLGNLSQHKMKRLIVLVILIVPFIVTAQNTFTAAIKDAETKERLIGATAHIPALKIGASTDTTGKLMIKNIPAGKYEIQFSYTGYARNSIVFEFPIKDSLSVEILLANISEQLGEVTITSSTRSSRNIANIPTRIETIAAGELEEKSVMQPGNIKMLLTESTGIQTQQTSQVSGSSSIRIQGLDGKYTQLLQDGFPLYSGFASGLSILQIPPLNLKRVEVIKGSTSTLYGGGAIAGLINLITKEPIKKRELSALVNVNQTAALDMSSFYAERYKKTGLTVYAAGNFQKAYDNNKDGFSDIPEFSRYTINPKFFYYPNDKTTLSFGLNAGFEKRTGGDIKAISNNPDPVHVFYERNSSNRYSSQTKYDKTFSDKTALTIKNSIGYFNRKIQRATYGFEGQQFATFSEANYLIPNEKAEWNIGLTYITDNFKHLNTTVNKLDYYSSVFGIFAQHNLTVSKKTIVESGLRIDITNRNKIFALPRVSLLYKINSKLTSRIGGGLGYKLPTIFSEDAEEIAFQNILPLKFSKVNPEKSAGLNADLNYKTSLFDKLYISVNQLFFYTVIQKPLVLAKLSSSGNREFQNANGNIDTKGFESNVKIRYNDISCYIGYTYIDATKHFDNLNYTNPLTSKHRLNANLMYESEERFRLAYEVFYIGKQYLSSGKEVRDYWVMGVSGEYKFKHISLFLNLENFLDTRQSRWEPMYSGNIQNPQFREVYTPTEGFIFNGGFKLNL